MKDDLAVIIGSAVPPTQPSGWPDVLDRAARRRQRLRRRALSVSLPALALAAAIPALAVSGRLTFGSHIHEPRVPLRAELRFGSGETVGRVDIEMPGLLTGGKFRTLHRLIMTRRGLRVAHEFELRWRLTLAPDARGAARAKLARATGSTRTKGIVVCTACQSMSSGRLVVSPRMATALVNEQVDFVLTTERGRARGRIALRKTLSR